MSLALEVARPRGGALHGGAVADASIRPPHIEGFFVSEKGYRHDLRPAFYWRMWSDAILHRIHLRVLRHIKRLSEEEVRS